MKKKCLYSLEKCHSHRYKDKPFCYNHYKYLLNIINDQDHLSLIQNGGSFLSAISKVGEITNMAEKGIAEATRIKDEASQLANRVEGITGQLSALTGSFDDKFSQNKLIANMPLGTTDNFQSFGDYVCIKKSFLEDLRVLLFELLAKRTE